MLRTILCNKAFTYRGRSVRQQCAVSLKLAKDLTTSTDSFATAGASADFFEKQFKLTAREKLVLIFRFETVLEEPVSKVELTEVYTGTSMIENSVSSKPKIKLSISHAALSLPVFERAEERANGASVRTILDPSEDFSRNSGNESISCTDATIETAVPRSKERAHAPNGTVDVRTGPISCLSLWYL